MRNPAESKWYFIYENMVGKEIFFEKFLNDKSYCKPMGDKCLPEYLARKEINIDDARINALKMFYSISYYLNKINLEIQDVCFMINKNGSMFWSEINQDCMRIKPVNNSNNGYDKDIWRAGGSDAKKIILNKWREFNPLLAKCLIDKSFLADECYNKFPYYSAASNEYNQLCNSDINEEYRSIYRILCGKYNTPKRIIAKITIDDNDLDVKPLINNISIFPDIMISNKNNYNTELQQDIKELATKYYIHYDGVKNLTDIQDILSSSARRVIIDYYMTNLLDKISTDRIIVRLDITDVDKIHLLSKLNIKVVVVKLDVLNDNNRKELLKMYNECNKYEFEKILIECDRPYINNIWSLNNYSNIVIAIPIINFTAHNNKSIVGKIYCSILSASNNSKIPGIVQSNDGKVRGLIYMNDNDIVNICNNRFLSLQKVTKIAVNCDNSSLLITVDDKNPFCHLGSISCFSLQKSIKGNLMDLMDYISNSSNSLGEIKSDSIDMEKYPGLSLMNSMNEFWELIITEYLKNKNNIRTLSNLKLDKCCDFLVNFFIYLASCDINIEDIFNKLNAIRWNPRLIQNNIDEDSDTYVIGITGNKYSSKTDNFSEDILGLRIIRSKGRNMKITYEIVNKDNMIKYGIPVNKKLSFVGVSPKDMPILLTTKKINAVITYNTVMDNYPEVSKLITSVPDNDLKLALISRIEENISVTNFDSNDKIFIATEHPVNVKNHLYNKYGNVDKFVLNRVIGSSETFLINETSIKYHLCDALIESGKTLVENNLKIWDIILNKGEVTIGFYSNIYYLPNSIYYYY